jgi:hypothetical protein
MHWYIAGPMRGKPGLNRATFAAAARWLRANGETCYNPGEHGDEQTDEDCRPLAEYMASDLPEVCRADAIMLLPGWEQSQGAAIEAEVARRLYKKVGYWPEGREGRGAT